MKVHILTDFVHQMRHYKRFLYIIDSVLSHTRVSLPPSPYRPKTLYINKKSCKFAPKILKFYAKIHYSGGCGA